MNSIYGKIADHVVATVDFSPLRGKAVSLTGVNGLLGSHLLHALSVANRKLDLSLQVVGTSRSGPAPWIKDVFAQEKFRYVQLDLRGPFASSRLGKPDYLFHAATYGQPKKFLEDPLGTMTLNSQVTAQLLDLVSEKNGRFLFASSSEIYGNPPRELMPVGESYHGNTSPLDHRSPYTSSKRFGETLCKIYQDLGRVHARIARVSSVYGPGVNLTDDRVLNVFIRRALDTGALTMLDRGLQKRHWLYISDATAMLAYILMHAKEMVYNVSGSDLRSIADLASYIGEELDIPVVTPSVEDTANHTEGAPDMINIDNSRILHEMQMGNLVPLRQGVADCIAWNRTLLKTG